MNNLQDYNKSVSCVSIKDNCVIFYNKYIGERYMTQKFLDNMSNLTKTTGNGVMKGKKVSKAKSILSNWINSSNSRQLSKLSINDVHARKHTFVTLTLPSVQVHTDEEIKRLCLSPFIQRLVNEQGIKHYYWRAESQKNGNIHFHIIVDMPVKWMEIRRLWNLQMDKLGYIKAYSSNMLEFYKDGFRMTNNSNDKRTMLQQFKAYNEGVKSGFTDPNSTDIHSFRDINNICAYVVKYMTKEQGYRKITGRLHGYSDGLNSIDNFKKEMDNESFQLANLLKKDKSVKQIIQERCVVYVTDSVSFMRSKGLSILHSYRNFVHDNLNNLYNFNPVPLPPLIPVIEYVKPSVYRQMSIF